MPDASILIYGGRFKLWDRPAVYPQVDLVNRTPEGPVFDLNVQDADGGAQYLRVDHVEEMAFMLGWKSPEDVEQILAENAKLKNQINNLPNAIEELKDGIEARIRQFYSDLDESDGIVPDDSEDTGSDAKDAVESDSGTESDDLEELGFGLFERPNDVSGDSGNGKSNKADNSSRK